MFPPSPVSLVPIHRPETTTFYTTFPNFVIAGSNSSSPDSHPMKCGERSTEPLLPAEKELQIEQWPWVGALYNGTGDFSPEFICVVTVLNDRFVIISVLCISLPEMKAPDLTVRLGAANLIDESESLKIFQVENMYVNGATDWLKTIALLKLSSKIEFNQFIQPICLKEAIYEEEIIRTTGFVTGWKKSWFESDERRLKEASMSVVENSNCSEYNSAENSTFCAARKGMEVNNNRLYLDLNLHAGGLYVEDNGKWFLRGVAILDINSKYWTFSNIDFHLPWIMKTIG